MPGVGAKKYASVAVSSLVAVSMTVAGTARKAAIGSAAVGAGGWTAAVNAVVLIESDCAPT
jgi:hypothetical protein